MLRSNISIKKKTADSIKWGIHKETGLPVWIDDVEANGLACNCCCPVCGVDLKACTLGKKQQHHYKHRANNDCYYSNDIAVYKWLHNQLTSAKTLCVPATFTYVGWTRQMITNRRIVEIRDIQFHADINHFPPLLIAEIDGILTRILVSTPYYFDKSDYSQFVQEAKENNWQCLEFFLPENFSFSDIPDFGYLKTFLFHSADACHWIYNREEVEVRYKLLKEARVLTYRPLSFYRDPGMGKFICPLHKKQDEQGFYALRQDCQGCPYCLQLDNHFCKCLAEANIKSLDDMKVPSAIRRSRFVKEQRSNEEALSAALMAAQTATQTAIKKDSAETKPLPRFAPEKEPGYQDVCRMDPKSTRPVYDSSHKRWYFCIQCNRWNPVNQMWGFGNRYGLNKGECKACAKRRMGRRKVPLK